MSWRAILFLAAGAELFKQVGFHLAGRIRPTPRFIALTALLPPALLAALVVVQTLADGTSLVIDPRLAGVAAGGLVAWRRAPFVVVVVVAAAVTATLRAST